MSVELKITRSTRTLADLPREVREALAKVPGQIVATGLAPYKSSVSGFFTSHTGKLLQSFKAKSKNGAGSIQSRSKQVNILDLGGTITAKNGLLFIPQAGTARKAGRKKKGALLGEWKGQFARVKSVTIAPRNFLEPANRQLDQLAEKMLGDALENGDGT